MYENLDLDRFFEGLFNKVSNRENGNVIVEMCVTDRMFKEGRRTLTFFLFVLKIEFNTKFLFVCIVLIWKIPRIKIIFLKYKEWNVIVERCITGQYLKRTDV